MVEISEFSLNNPRFISLLNRQRETPIEVLETVSSVLDNVKQRGDAALYEYMLEYDGIDLSSTSLRVTDEEFDHACETVDVAYTEALQKACNNLFKYHQYQLIKGYKVEYPEGVVLERKVKPIDRVGITVPAGVAPLSSSLYMNLVPALTAGVPDISIISSPKNNRIDPTILYTADFLGIRNIYKISGAQGIAALAFGTESVQAVDKIVGPGNIFVQTAKKFLYGTVGIDSLAGPSEIVIIADERANAEYAAADMLSQAEHGTGLEASIVFCLHRDKAEEIKSNLNRFLGDRELNDACSQSLKAFGNIFIVDSIDTAVAAANSIAPEHVEVMCRDSDSVAGQITNAGAVFVGDYSPEPVGDYYCGSNHILPTGGTARFSSGLTVMDFMRSYSVVKYTRDALQSHGSTILSLIRPEGMRAHMLSIAARGIVQEKTEPQKLS